MDNLIHVCPLARLESVVAQSQARYVVSAINPWSIPQTPKGISNNNHLKLAINDIELPHPDLVHPEGHHIEKLVSFAERWGRDGPLVVHCLAGISRSSASAFIILCHLNAKTAELEIAQLLRNASPTASPNSLMVTLADNILDRNGRMIAAIEALSPAVAAFEAEPFSIASVCDT